MEPFTLIEETPPDSGPYRLFPDLLHLTSAPTADHDLHFAAALRAAFPETIVTAIPATNTPLRAFAAAGLASCVVDKDTDAYASWRGYRPPSHRAAKGSLAEAVDFAKYRYVWQGQAFILYCVGAVQYVLKERGEGEHALGPSGATDALILAVGEYVSSITEIVWVYDGYWRQSRGLWEEVRKASWEDVILEEGQKRELREVTGRFFDSRGRYEELGVPWKRGVIFHGPPGNGKTVSIKALSHELYQRKDPILTLYVKSAETTYDIGSVFRQARALAPCMLVLEDIESIVTSATRSYFFNELDGLASNSGLFVVASTNYLDRLDPGLTKRPSRFDRKYLFPLPDAHERELYCEYWQRKLQSNEHVEFPRKLCRPMARVTPGFSFAFLQECFVATMLALAREEGRASGGEDGGDEGLEEYEIWVVFKQQAAVLRKEIEGQRGRGSGLAEWCRANGGEDGEAAAATAGAGREMVRHCECCRRRGGREGGEEGVAKGMARMRVREEILPELPWYEQKMEYVNSAALEKRL